MSFARICDTPPLVRGISVCHPPSYITQAKPYIPTHSSPDCFYTPCPPTEPSYCCVTREGPCHLGPRVPLPADTCTYDPPPCDYTCAEYTTHLPGTKYTCPVKTPKYCTTPDVPPPHVHILGESENPEFFGPIEWASMHITTVHLPVGMLNPVRAASVRAWLFSIPERLPCVSCATHAGWELSKLRLQILAAKTGEEFFRVTVDLHNRVNARLGKQPVGYVAARTLWAGAINKYYVA